ncbi:MAG TPA: hypothetical protein VE684_14115, partial [Crenalkalicoccus sp.]|nr:hypothetical protein [Crenalkalicoccus sp.]
MGPAAAAGVPDEPVPVLVEQRFPLKLSEEVPALRRLYEESKRARWDPRRQVPWDALGAAAIARRERAAAAATWRRRAWVEATALTETPALVVRFCMEKGREAETRMFLTVRNTEEAWQVEACDMLARALAAPDGAKPPARPGTEAYAALFNRRLHRAAFDARNDLDALVAVHCLFEDGLEHRLAQAHRASTANPAIAAVLDRFVAAKARHASFGRLYLQHRAPGLDDAARGRIAAAIVQHVTEVEFAGYHLPWLAPNAAAAEAAADAVTATAGLGAATPEAEAAALRAWLTELRAYLAGLGV